jgi:small-conductance mechanosensitive channel/CRP-like cAMP-binding protein
MRKTSFAKIVFLLVLPIVAGIVVIDIYFPELRDPEGKYGGVPWKVALTALWISLAMAAVSVVSYLLSPEMAHRRGKAEMPALLRDLIRYGVFVFLAAVILRALWGDKVTPIIGALGIGGVVLGLALQETLSNFFAGLALLAEKPFAHGDWVRIGDKPEGQVEHVTWRATKIRTRDSDYLILPNSAVAKEVIQNFRLPTLVHAIRIVVGTSYDDPPDKVKATLLSILEGVPAVLKSPAPVVYLTSYADFAINYQVKCYIEDYASRPIIEDQIMTRIWYAFKRSGIEIPFPIRTVYMHSVPAEAEKPASRIDMERALRAVAIFAPLGEEEQRRLAASVTTRHFGPGEPVIRQGDPGEALYVILSGAASIVVRSPEGSERTVATVGPGDFFGEMSLLTGDPRTATVRAESGMVLGEVSKEALLPILSANPGVAERIAEIVTLRKQGLDKAHAEAALDSARRAEVQGATRNLLSRMRSFFRLH